MWFQLFAAALAVIFAILRLCRRNKRFPPGPFAWPIIGCLPSVGFQYRHKTFFNLSKKYGPIMYIQLGGADMILIHSPELAMEALRTQDPHFCSRPLTTPGKYIAFDYNDIDFSPYNAHWRLMRKIFNTELMSNSRLNMQAKMRKEEVMAMAARVLDYIKNGQLVDMKKIADDVVLNILLQMLFGKRYENSDSNVAKELRNFEPYVREAVILVGELNIGDLVPSLARFDLQGFEGRYQKLMEKVGKLFELIIDEHKHALEQSGTQMSEESKDVIHVLLSQKGENKVTTKEIMGVMTDMLLGGLDTTVRAIEWAIAEMVANPHTLLKAQLELDNVVGKHRLFEESDIEKLPYLQAVVKEALRLHPPVPITNPHLNEAPATLAGYNLPRGCMVFVNIWGLGRDPSVWENPLQFNPDRFIGSDLNVHGNHYQLLPFSSGRRKCPAYHMATLKVQHVLGMLLQCFEWAPPVGVSAEKMDLTEGVGIVLGLKNALLVSAKSRVDPSLYTSRC
nr:cytochrome P450 family 782 subfamily C polypeptide 1 [Phlegmariurus tetrastichus]